MFLGQMSTEKSAVKKRALCKILVFSAFCPFLYFCPATEHEMSTKTLKRLPYLIFDLLNTFRMLKTMKSFEKTKICRILSEILVFIRIVSSLFYCSDTLNVFLKPYK